MSTGVEVIAWILAGLLYVAFFFAFRHKEVRAAWARRAEDGWSWKQLIPRAEKRWLAWGVFVVFGLQAALSFYEGRLWLAVPSMALSLIGLVQGVLGPAETVNSPLAEPPGQA